ncbi:MAG: hypothetical protein ABSB94_00490 [Syntrophorhabdales bacterium]|jgi:hypothetical protein
MNGTEGQEKRALQELRKELLEGGYIAHETASGITRQIIGQGLGSLTDNQRDVYRWYIELLFENDEVLCRRCQSPITDLPMNERYMLIRTGYCPLCDYRMGKND